jgi:hypothetical protein
VTTTPTRPTPTRTIEADVIRGFVIGSVIGSIAVFVLWGAVALLGGLANVNAGVVGAFTAAWGGPGFGGMLGAVLGYSKHQH